eukprot:GILI01012900.1.p1 GENE.GILI01012900.1~~GILI01012900.1.p1  ORF type:complete len:424 (+),score=134.40 GILI01012900.1:146-1417(+)
MKGGAQKSNISKKSKLPPPKEESEEEIDSEEEEVISSNGKDQNEDVDMGSDDSDDNGSASDESDDEESKASSQSASLTSAKEKKEQKNEQKKQSGKVLSEKQQESKSKPVAKKMFKEKQDKQCTRHAKKAIKKYKVFETRKLVRKLKTLRENKSKAEEEKNIGEAAKAQKKIEEAEKDLEMFKSASFDECIPEILKAINFELDRVPPPKPLPSSIDAGKYEKAKDALVNSKVVKQELLFLQNELLAQAVKLREKVLQKKIETRKKILAEDKKPLKKRQLRGQVWKDKHGGSTSAQGSSIFVESLASAPPKQSRRPSSAPAAGTSASESEDVRRRDAPRRDGDRKPRGDRFKRDDKGKEKGGRGKGQEGKGEKKGKEEEKKGPKILSIEEMHPSWQAKKLAQQKQTTVAFQGTKVKFGGDSDDE